MARDGLDFQTFSISRDGELKVESKAETGHRPVVVESFRTFIDSKVASEIVDLMVETLLNAPLIAMKCDGPTWEMTLTGADGSRYKCGGCMWADPEYNGLKLSERIRTLLMFHFIAREYSIFDPMRLVLFDGFNNEEDEEEDEE